MTEVNHHVYDLLYPSPISLKNIAAISIATELWRNEINKYSNTNTLDQLYFNKKIPLDNLTPHIPSTLLTLIEKYSKKVGSSIEDWLNHHYGWIFKFHHNDHNHVLKDFDDFVVNFDGRINDVETAKRVILCDRFSDLEKFIIACHNCFEKDIVRIWPSVSSSINIEEFDQSTYPFLYYWFRRLRFGIFDEDTILMMLKNMTGIEYFWNAINNSDGRVAIVAKTFHHSLPNELSRYLLPKLNEKELDMLMLARGDVLIKPHIVSPSSMHLVLPVWRLVKDKITESHFISLIRKIFEKQTNYLFPFCGNMPDFCEIWNSAADKLKRAAIPHVLSDDSLFVRSEGLYYSCRSIELLLSILSDVTIEERKSFWNTNWPNLILGTSSKDLRDLINQCIGNQDEITEFKKTQLSSYEIIAPSCKEFLKGAKFQQIDEFLNFCCHEEKTRKEIKLKLLYEEFELDSGHIRESKSLDGFIKSAIEDADEIIKFKNDLSSKLTKLTKANELKYCLMLGEYREIIQFVDTIVLSQEVAENLKECHFLANIWDILTRSPPYLSRFNGDELSNFLKWCFGDDKKAERFKLTLPVEEIVRKIADKIISRGSPSGRKSRDVDFDNFIKWYFTNPEDLAEFKASLADVFEKLDQL